MKVGEAIAADMGMWGSYRNDFFLWTRVVRSLVFTGITGITGITGGFMSLFSLFGNFGGDSW